LPWAPTLAGQAKAGGELVKFPENYAQGVRYAIVERGNLREEIYASHAALDAVKQGQPIPSGTVITRVDYRNGKLFRYVVMEKRTGWGAEYPAEKRNGEWKYQAFGADQSVNDQEDLNRCFSCPKSKAQQDFVDVGSDEERDVGRQGDDDVDDRRAQKDRNS
jgi:Cytochrome P460